MAWLLYGQQADGELLHISEAARGDACGCFCPHCQTPLAAKKGNVKVHHFAHLGQTCAYVSVYDFLHIEHYVDTTLSLTDWASWKEQDIQQTGIRLQAEYEQYRDEMASLRTVIEQARERLDEISQPHPNRKQRSKVRQANFEVLQQWDAYVADHNAPLPDLERVRDIDSVRYTAFYYIQDGRWGGRYTTGLDVWPNQMWYPEHKDQDWIPVWLSKSGLALFNEYGPLRRKLATAELHLEAFQAEKTRFERFHLYLLLIEFESRPPLFKIGITSRTNLAERMAEIRQDLRVYNVTNVSVLTELPGHAYLESYFKHKYAPQQTKLGQLTEYFAFSDEQMDVILNELRCLSATPEVVRQDRRQQIRIGMAQARQQGIHVGRPKGSEAEQRFLQKPKSREIATLMLQHPDWSLREVARHTGIALNTVCKVVRLIGKPPGSPSRSFISETNEPREDVIGELEKAEGYLVITVVPGKADSQQPIGMHLSRWDKVGPALLTLLRQDDGFCEALGELVEEARRR